MDEHKKTARAVQRELFPDSDDLYWQFPQRRRTQSSMRYQRSGAAWWFGQMRVAAEQSTAIETPPVAGQQPE